MRAWSAAIGAGLAFDYYRWRRNDQSTFCDSVRYLFRVDTPQGRKSFLLALAIFARHILK